MKIYCIALESHGEHIWSLKLKLVVLLFKLAYICIFDCNFLGCDPLATFSRTDLPLCSRGWDGLFHQDSVNYLEDYMAWQHENVGSRMAFMWRGWWLVCCSVLVFRPPPSTIVWRYPSGSRCHSSFSIHADTTRELSYDAGGLETWNWGGAAWSADEGEGMLKFYYSGIRYQPTVFFRRSSLICKLELCYKCHILKKSVLICNPVSAVNAVLWRKCFQ